MSIDKRLLGETLYVHILSDSEENNTYRKQGSLFIPDSAPGMKSHRIAKVLQVGDELTDKFSEGDLIKLRPVGREYLIKEGDKQYHWIQNVKQDVISIIQ